ncbi:MAG: hypothetical protein ACLFVS_01345 [Candidatus Acetothermia bacterium]
MDRIVRALDRVDEINGLIYNLKECLDLFEQGEKEAALERLEESEEGIEGLIASLPQEEVPPGGSEKIEANLSSALNQLSWISENVDNYNC